MSYAGQRQSGALKQAAEEARHDVEQDYPDAPPVLKSSQPATVGQNRPEIARQTDTPANVIAAAELQNILTLAEETAFRWDILRDKMVWTPNVNHILGVSNSSTLASGSGFGLHIDPDFAANRYRTIIDSKTPDLGDGVAYRLQYRFMPLGRRDKTSIWLEEHGRWFKGNDDRPALAGAVVRVITERYEEEQKLRFLSNHDPLTGQMNRACLTESINDALLRAIDRKTGAAFLLAGVNNLTQINETHGFDIADEVIATVGSRLRRHMRGGDDVGRYSSNKFGIILNDCGPEAIKIAGHRLMSAVRDSIIDTNAGPVSTTVSIGGVQLPKHADNVNQATGRALESLDLAKAKPHDTFNLFKPSPSREKWRKRNMDISDEIIRALSEDRMVLAVQPIVDSKNLQPSLYECLLRMRKPDGALVAASEFIPDAEKLGLSRLIDLRVLELSVRLAKATPGVRYSFNVSGLTANDTEWLDSLRTLVCRDQEVARRLVVEITETAAIEDVDETIAFVSAIKKLGCSTAIDDFGAGHTSFRNLKLLGVDMVKIDGSFIQNILDNEDDQLLVKMFVDLVNGFGLESVGEWVEDEATSDFLRALGITHMQGFHFGIPQLAQY